MFPKIHNYCVNNIRLPIRTKKLCNMNVICVESYEKKIWANKSLGGRSLLEQTIKDVWARDKGSLGDIFCCVPGHLEVERD